MAETIHLDIVSAEGQIFTGDAHMVVAPASQGELGILPRHAPLKPGEVRVQQPDGAEQVFYVGGGAMEIQPGQITILADTALRAKDIDEAAAQAAMQRAEESLRDKTDKIDQAQALAELARAAAQLKVLERLRKLRG